MSLLDLASLVLAPTATKEGKVYSAIPDTGDGDMTFTRGSSATRVNSAGLIEKGRENLVLYSEEFDNAAWVKTTDGQVTITANAAVAPDGTTTADKMIPSAIAGFHCVQQTITLSASITSISIFAKAAENSFLQIFDSLTTDFANFNLTTGEVASVDQYIATIENVGNGWYRCTAFKANPSGNFTFRYGVVTSGTAVRGESFTGNGTDGLLIWGSQAELGLVATDYIPTTTTAVYEGITDDVPRVDYSGGGCPSLLLEPQRTNVVTTSEHIGSYSVSNLSVSYNNATSPEGVQNATLVTGDAGTSTKVVNFNPASSGAYTISVFAKYDSHQWIQLGMGGIATYANFDIQNGVVGSTNGTSDIEDYGNGWYRCSVQMTTGTPISHYIGMVDSGSAVRLATSSSTNSFWAYGMQSEIGSYPTSYLPTYGTSTTRVADSCSKTGISELIGQSEGTIYSEFVVNGFTDFGTPLCINNGSTSESVWLTTFSNGDIRAEVFSSAAGGVQASFTKTGGVVNQTYKIAIGYAHNNFAFFINGVQIGTTDTSGSVPTGMNRADFDYANASLFTKSALEINQAILFPTRLTNDQLEELTK